MNTQHDSYYAGGRWHAARGAESATVIDPATEAEIGRVRFASREDVDLAVRAAAQAFEQWRDSPLDERRQALQRLGEELRRREAELVGSFTAETGCPVATSRVLQGVMVHAGLAATLEGLDAVKWQEPVRHSRIVRTPVGVVLGITAWNAPLFQMAAKTAAALAAGCTIVLKPSELAPGSATLFAQAVDAAGLPPGVVNLVFGGPAVGEALVTHPLVAQVSFTGSPQVGRRIMAAAAEGLKRVVLELGGKSAAVLLDDADFEQAVPAALRSCLMHAGQICAAQTRLVVPRARLDEATALVRQAVAGWKVGDPRDEATQLGPLASAAQFARVQRAVQQAVDAGAVVIAGGPGRAPGSGRGYFVAPTVLQVGRDSPVAREEVFGPVLSLIAHDGDDDAVAIANDTPYGLSGAVWSRDAARALRVAERLHTGQVILNGAAQNLAAPFGGVGASGFGRENGRFGIEAFLDHKNLQGVVVA